ncbi:OmpA family protein [Vibrio agarivorans]|uniref:OmpA family protein n=1 Tax=Vibrio agarivorans TaxID=153622 RepID=UPI00222FD071|nr:OmpA family protein [Vibrio agarivorans]
MKKVLFGVLILLNSTVVLSEENLQYYCKSQSGEMRQVVSIHSVEGIGQHRQGFLQIQQKANDSHINSALLSNAMLDISSMDCESEISKRSDYADQNNMVARVHFAFDSDYVSPLAEKTLDAASRHLAKGEHQLLVEGHTDSTGSEKYNHGLGLDRAVSTSEKLISYGVDRRNITMTTYGETKPLVDNNSRSNRALNRRAEVYIVD